MATSLGYIENIQGQVQVRHSDGVTETMYERAELFRGDTLITQKESTATLKMNNGKSIPLEIDSSTTVNRNYSVKTRANTHHKPSHQNNRHEEEIHVSKRSRKSRKYRDDDKLDLETASGLFTPTSTIELTSKNFMDSRTTEVHVDVLQSEKSVQVEESNYDLNNYPDQDLLMANAAYSTDLGNNVSNINTRNNDDSRQGSVENDVLVGSELSDTILGNAGDDSISGEAGDDIIEGGIGNDSIDGGLGDDTLFGDAGDDTIVGAEGNDSINAGSGDDYIDAGDGNDIVDAGSGDDTVYGGSEIDYIFGQDGDDVIYSQGGDDTIFAGSGDDIVVAGLGNDNIRGDSGRDTLYGDDGDDVLNGGTDSDKLYGGAGADTIDTGNGDDYVDAGLGDDTIDAREGNNIIDGGLGTDTVLMNGQLSDYGVTFKEDEEGRHTLLIDNLGNTTELINVETIDFISFGETQSVQTSTLLNDTLYISDQAKEDEDFDFPGSMIEGVLFSQGLISNGITIIGFGEIGQDLIPESSIYDVGNGIITNRGNDLYTFRSDENYNGNLAFSIFLSDGSSIKAVAEVSAVNDPTITVLDTASVVEDSVVTGNVLLNDSDADQNDVDGLVLEVASFSINKVSYTVETTAIITDIGSISFQKNGDYLFTATDNYYGIVPEIIYITNTGSQSTLNITVTEEDDLTLTNSDRADLNEDSFIEGNVLTNDSDIDSDLSIVRYQVEGDTTVYTAGQYSNSEISGSFLLNANGSYIFTAASDYDGSVPVVTYETNTGVKDTLTIVINPVDDDTVTFLDTASTQANAKLVVSREEGLLSNDVDIDSALSITTFRLDISDNGNYQNFNAGESIAVSGKGTLIINSDGSYSLDPMSDYDGIFPLVTYTTNTGTSNTLAITISALDPAIAGVVSVNAITADDIINIAESNQVNITVSGTAIGGDISANDSVSFYVNGTHYTTTVQVNGTWTVNVAGSDLAINSEFKIDVHSSNTVGSTVISSITSNHLVDVTAPNAPTVTLLNDSGTNSSDLITNDGTLNVIISEEGNTLQYSSNAGISWNNDAPVAVIGENTVLVREIDSVGNISESSTITFMMVGDAVAGTVLVNDITLDDSLSLLEAQGSITVSGRASGGDISQGDSVTAIVNGVNYTSTLDIDGNFVLNVAGIDLANDSHFNIDVTSSNILGDVVVSSVESIHTIETPVETNLIFVIDVSDKMGDTINGMTRLDLVKASLNNLLDVYDQKGDVNVQIYTFSDSSYSSGWVYGNVDYVKSYIANNVNLASPYDDTDYDNVIAQVINDQYTIPISADETQTYFFSEGDATGNDYVRNDGFFFPKYIYNENTLDIEGENSSGGTTNEIAVWETYLSETGSTIHAVAVGEGTNTSDLSAIGTITTITNEYDLSNEVLNYNGSAVDMGDGFDTLILEGGTQIDFDLVSNIQNIEVIELKSDSDQLHNITASDILSMTDDDNYLEIVGVGHIDFSDATKWNVSSDDIGNKTYTDNTNLDTNTVTIHVENIIHIDAN